MRYSRNRLEHELAALARFLLFGYVLAPEPLGRAWRFRGAMFQMMIGRPPSAARRVFCALSGLEDQHPAAAVRLLMAEKKPVSGPPQFPPESNPLLELNLPRTATFEHGGNAVLHIQGELCGDFPLAATLATIGRAGHVDLFINSVGGNSAISATIRTALAGKSSTATVVSKCYSAAMEIFVSAKHRRICRSAYLMVHEGNIMAYGNVAMIRARADELERFNAEMKAFYKQLLPSAPVDDWIAGKDIYLSAPEAVQHGLAHEIVDDPPAPPPPPDAGPPAFAPDPPPDDGEAVALARELFGRLQGTFKDKAKFAETLRSFCQ